MVYYNQDKGKEIKTMYIEKNPNDSVLYPYIIFGGWGVNVCNRKDLKIKEN